jgi:Na+/glutamate symporter
MANGALATVHVCYSKPEAEVLCCMLNAYGIPAFVMGGATAAVAGHLIVALGGLEIRVPESMEADALSLLAQVEQDTSLPESTAFKEKPIRNGLMLIVSFLTGYIPTWLRNRKYPTLPD